VSLQSRRLPVYPNPSSHSPVALLLYVSLLSPLCSPFPIKLTSASHHSPYISLACQSFSPCIQLCSYRPLYNFSLQLCYVYLRFQARICPGFTSIYTHISCLGPVSSMVVKNTSISRTPTVLVPISRCFIPYAHAIFVPPYFLSWIILVNNIPITIRPFILQWSANVAMVHVYVSPVLIPLNNPFIDSHIVSRSLHAEFHYTCACGAAFHTATEIYFHSQLSVVTPQGNCLFFFWLLFG
jgi:hypothetical protein